MVLVCLLPPIFIINATQTHLGECLLWFSYFNAALEVLLYFILCSYQLLFLKLMENEHFKLYILTGGDCNNFFLVLGHQSLLSLFVA